MALLEDDRPAGTITHRNVRRAIDLLQEMLLERGVIRADFTLYQDFMDQRRDLLLVPEQGKCDADAARFRNTGNRLYLDGKYGEALGYAFALYNIDLAMKHDYPEKLMPKLRVRELNCKQQIAPGRSKGTVQGPRMDINVDTNLKIPFLAKGIKLRNCSNFNLLSTPRLFIYGLSLFDDNLAELKRFSEANEGAELNRFELDYSNLGRRELFRILHNTEARRDPIGELNGYLEEKLISYGYGVPSESTDGNGHHWPSELYDPSLEQARSPSYHPASKQPRLSRAHHFRIHFPVIPANIHTCDPNAQTAFESGCMKMVLLRSVPAGKPFDPEPGTAPPRIALYFVSRLSWFAGGDAGARSTRIGTKRSRMPTKPLIKCSTERMGFSNRCDDQDQALYKQRRTDVEVISDAGLFRVRFCAFPCTTTPHRNVVTAKLLSALQKIGDNLKDYLHLIIPALVKMFGPIEVPIGVECSRLSEREDPAGHWRLYDRQKQNNNAAEGHPGGAKTKGDQEPKVDFRAAQAERTDRSSTLPGLHDARPAQDVLRDWPMAGSVVTFCESVVETSSLMCFAETPNKNNKIMMIAELLEKSLVEDIENESVCIRLKREQARRVLPGPDNTSSNKAVLGAVKDSIEQGFQWSTRERPLYEKSYSKRHVQNPGSSPIRNPSTAEVVPTSRRVAYSA
ncbi:conserved hypothetical protein [Culex quinquefasciatus]|uniref:Uncharacterized protein n=1 Tax=Culex quinquefasciatus TaxID=7176 RepID=B0W5T1_CULQU|nr:conserved hypothetical protein [Culex quinquefasciatus]|eukprot:XP_001844065.1 conserved hypothetical protein [Culex quinquefasciatus]